jgi:hypothetical protein
MKKKKPGRPLHSKSPTMALRRQTQRETFARLLLMGWTTEKIARKLHVTPRAIRYAIESPEFLALYTKLQQERYKVIDRKMDALLGGAVESLEKMLSHKDWKANDAALNHIFCIHGKFVDRFAISGTLEHTGPLQLRQVELIEGAAGGMTDEMRAKAAELLRLQRAMFPRQLPARIGQDSSHHDEHHPINGRFVSTPDDETGR